MTRTFHSVQEAFDAFRRLGASRFYFKVLAANDNCKQQIYFGGSFDVIRIFPYTGLQSCPGGKRPNFKADLNFWWVDADGRPEQAPGAQLILYPDYPEVRLSGFLRGCRTAPRERLQPLSGEQRLSLSTRPRVLFLGASDDGRVLGHLSGWGDEIALEAIEMRDRERVFPVASVFLQWTPLGRHDEDNRDALLARLRMVYLQGWIESFRLDGRGERIAYTAQNGVGYTLEGSLGITPNGAPQPDLLGWEIKAHNGTSARVTLMTPEPTSGIYDDDFRGFMRKYGRGSAGSRLDFTGTHQCGKTCSTSGLLLRLDGYDAVKGEITDPSGGLHLYDPEINLVAGWAFTDLMDLWRRKHNRTAFVSYDKKVNDAIHYRYGPTITTAEGADFERYLAALSDGFVVYDPGINLKPPETPAGRWKPKKRNQLRIGWKNLSQIYDRIRIVDFSD